MATTHGRLSHPLGRFAAALTRPYALQSWRTTRGRLQTYACASQMQIARTDGSSPQRDTNGHFIDRA